MTPETAAALAAARRHTCPIELQKQLHGSGERQSRNHMAGEGARKPHPWLNLRKGSPRRPQPGAERKAPPAPKERPIGQLAEAILAVLGGKSMTPSELTEATGANRKSVWRAAKRLSDRGLLVRTRKGMYRGARL
jgi:hypothetical protein